MKVVYFQLGILCKSHLRWRGPPYNMIIHPLQTVLYLCKKYQWQEISVAYEVPPPPLRVPPWEAEGGGTGTHEGSSFNITSACISLPQARHSGVPRGAVVLLPPPGSSKGRPCSSGKYKIKRKLRLKSNTTNLTITRSLWIVDWVNSI